MPFTTRAIVVTEAGGLDVLQVQDREVGEPAAGQLLVRVAAAGVNFIDNYQRSGMYPIQTPYVMGSEGAGTVEAVGEGVRESKVGDRVAWSQTLGSASELALIPESDTVPIPESVSFDQAAAAMLQGMTAHYLVNSTYPVREGDTVLVHAAAGGVGQLLIQLIKAKGARVIGTVSTEAKAAKARALGADEVINYTEVDDLAAAVRGLTGGLGVAAVYDGVGRSTFDASLASLRTRGTLALFGAASGPVPPVDPQRLNAGGSLFLTRPTLAHHIASREELLLRGNEILAAVADGSLRIEIGSRYSFDDVGQAYANLTGRRTTGKLLLVP
ncbi:MAG: quinone oxidoreductase [Actinomycetota bacterium]|nr:quinone oxidoreductase [Actinomycetota bacterium]MDQ2955894.1 quinone oxidoreductase [Actinomycetota bacterium]